MPATVRAADCYVGGGGTFGVPALAVSSIILSGWAEYKQ